MAFWIVYQGNTWKRARAGGYLWAPKLGKKQQAQEYWSNMARVQPGDLIFAGVDNALRAIAEVTQPAYTAERPKCEALGEVCKEAAPSHSAR